MSRLDHHLLLADWLWTRFGFTDTRAGLARCRDIFRHAPTGLDDQGAFKFLALLKAHLNTPTGYGAVDADRLTRYDASIAKHWAALVRRRTAHEHRRPEPLYFQWLSLLFTEHYLDLLFDDLRTGQTRLRDALNEYRLSWLKSAKGADARTEISEFGVDELPRLALWCATGAGKTLLMHAHIRMLQAHLRDSGLRRRYNRFILITPNEGLSAQHVAEMELSGIAAARLEQESQDTTAEVCVIEVTKLKDKKGQTTVNVDHFGKNNVVLVDEGHRGAGGEEWMSKRRALCAEGFSIEYSATFGQAVHALDKKKATPLLEEYGKSILFDYSYRYFYDDGYGKDFSILNYAPAGAAKVAAPKVKAPQGVKGAKSAPPPPVDPALDLYLTGCLLKFFQQCRLYSSGKKAELVPYLLADPLMIFVGGSVTGAAADSDVVKIVSFFARFLAEGSVAQLRLGNLIKGLDGIVDTRGEPVFGPVFEPLRKEFNPSASDTPAKLHAALLATCFQSTATGRLTVSLLKGGDEIALRVGDGGVDFGVISVGEAPKLHKLLKTHFSDVLDAVEQPFVSSLFDDIPRPDSRVRFLIGAKKFTEGWSCWRVSAMGLMEVGKSEGAQIIQLFGRGVRLKGYEFGLRRAAYLQQQDQLNPPAEVAPLETLHVFGVKADYMAEFRAYLEEEGVSPDKNDEVVELPTLHNLARTDLKLVVPKRNAPDFKKSKFPPLERRRDLKVTSDWTPRLQSLSGHASVRLAAPVEDSEEKLPPIARRTLDRSALLADLAEHKKDNAHYNLLIDAAVVDDLLDGDQDWYRLYAPKHLLTFEGGDFGSRARLWQDMASDLLRRYASAFYEKERASFLNPYREVRTLKQIIEDYRSDDPSRREYAKACGAQNLVEKYVFTVEKSRATLIKQLRDLAQLVPGGQFTPLTEADIEVFRFGSHLYHPLVSLRKGVVGVQVQPTSLVKSERDFVKHLAHICEAKSHLLAGRDLYLLRNQSRGKGLSFFEESNVYPDFILWLVEKGAGQRQTVAFIDPHGLRDDRGIYSSKIAVAASVKELERQLGDKSLRLESFVVTPTPYAQVRHFLDGKCPKSATDTERFARFAEEHVYFMEESGAYLEQLIAALLT